MRFMRGIAAIVLAAFIAGGAAAQPRAPAAARVALVFGNSAYPAGALENPKNDATDVFAAFKRLGFDAELKLNATKADMDAAFRRFSSKADRAEVAILFYAGHGVQVNV